MGRLLSHLEIRSRMCIILSLSVVLSAMSLKPGGRCVSLRQRSGENGCVGYSCRPKQSGSIFILARMITIVLACSK